MAYVLSNQTPNIGSISWSNTHIVFDGVDHQIANGSSNQKYIYWLSASPNSLFSSNEYPQLGANDALVFLNRGGVGVSVLDSGTMDGGLVVPGTITSSAIATGAITADHIAAGAITTSKLAVVSSGAALNADPLCSDASAWWIADGGSFEIRGVVNAPAGKRAIFSQGGNVRTKLSALVGGKQYRVSFRILSVDGANGYLYARVYRYNDAGNLIGFLIGDGGGFERIPASEFLGWRNYEILFTPEIGTSTAELSFHLNWENNVGGFYLQDAKVEEIITSALIQDGAISAQKIQADAISAQKIQAGAVTTDKISARSITGDRIVANTITGYEILVNSIGADKIVAGSITGDRLVANTITSDKIAARTITGDRIVGSSITGYEILANSIGADKIVAGSITSTQIASDSITGDKIAANTIGASEIAAGAITAKHLTIGDFTNLCVSPTGETSDGWDGDVTAGDITGFWTSYGLQASKCLNFMSRDAYCGNWFDVNAGDEFYVEMDTAPFGGGASLVRFGVGLHFVDANGGSLDWQVIYRNIGDFGYKRVSGSVIAGPAAAKAKVFVQVESTSGVRLDQNGVGHHATNIHIRRKTNGNLIVDGSITANKISSNAVTSDKIFSNSITTDKLAVNSVTTDKIASGSITTDKLVVGSITSDRIAAGAITTSKLAVTSTGSSLNSDPNFEDPTAWWHASGAGHLFVDVQDGISGKKALRTSPNTQIKSKLTLKAGATYLLTAYARRTPNANGTMFMRIDTYASDGGFINSEGIQGHYAGTSWTYSEATITIPANAVTCELSIWGNWYAWEGYYEIQSPSVREVVQTALIADGAIVTQKLVAGAITADKIAANSIYGDKIAANAITSYQIQAGSITAEKIQAGTITGDKIAAGTIAASKLAIGTNTLDRIRVTSYGNNMSVHSGGNVYINGVFQYGSGRGITVGVFGLSSHLLEEYRQYDVYADGNARQAAADWINWFNENAKGQKLIVINSADAMSFDSTNNVLRAALKGCGASTTIDSIFGADRFAYALIGVAGIGEGNGIEQIKSQAATETGCDISTLLMDGNALGVGSGITNLTRLNSTHIEDGAITTGKIVAGAITGDKIAANSITADKLTVGSVSADKLQTGNGVNLIYNSDFQSGTDGWSQYISNPTYSGGAVFGRDFPDGNWRPVGRHSLGLRTNPDTPIDTAWYSRVNATEYRRYFFSVYAQVHRAWMYAGIHFMDANGTIIQTHTTNRLFDAQAGYTTLNNWPRLSVAATAPAGTAFIEVFMTKESSAYSGQDSYMMISCPMLELSDSPNPSDYTPGAGVLISGDSIKAGTLSGDRIVGRTISADKIATGTIGANEIAGGSITGDRIAGNTISADKLLANSITSSQIAGGSITGDRIAGGTVTGANIAGGSITGDKIAANSITAANMVIGDYSNIIIEPNGASGVSPFVGAYITTIDGNPCYQCDQYVRDTLTSATMDVLAGEQFYFSASMRFRGGGGAASNIGISCLDAQNNIIAWQVAAGTADTSGNWTHVEGWTSAIPGTIKIKIWWQRGGFNGDNGIWAMRDLVVKKRIGGSLIVDGTVTATQIAARAITGDRIAANTITGYEILANSIGADKIVANSITGTQIAAQTISGWHIAANSVTADRITAGSITGDKIAGNTISAGHIVAGSITGDKIAANQSITAPSIIGGTLSLGSGAASSFMEGGSAGFGRGGPFGGWGDNWHTIIYNNGQICTDNLVATNGTFKGRVDATSGTFENVTINNSLIVRNMTLGSGIITAFKATYAINKAAGWKQLATTVVDTGLSVDAWWNVDDRTYSASAGVNNGQVEAYGSSFGTFVTNWSIKVDKIFFKSRWNSPSTIHLELSLWAEVDGGISELRFGNSSPMWKVFKVT